MSKAAVRENIALAALSKRIASLERDLEVSLLKRGAGGRQTEQGVGRLDGVTRPDLL